MSARDPGQTPRDASIADQKPPPGEMGRAGEGVGSYDPHAEQHDARMGGGIFSPGSREAHWLQMSAGGGSSQEATSRLELPMLRLPPISSFMDSMVGNHTPTAGLVGPARTLSVEQEQQAWHLMSQKAVHRELPHSSPSTAPPRSPQFRGSNCGFEPSTSRMLHGAMPGAPPGLALADAHHAGAMPHQVPTLVPRT